MVCGLLLSIMTNGCKEKERLELSTKDLVVDFRENEKEVNISSNVSWKVQGNADWYTISVDSGNMDGVLKVITQINESMIGRTDTIFVTGGENCRDSIIIKQEGVPDSDESFFIESNNYLFGPTASTQKIALTAIGDWKIDTSNKPAWLKVSPMSGKGDAEIEISVDNNDLLILRKAVLVLNNTLSGKSLLVKIDQNPAEKKGISDYKYLGAGYNARDYYAYDSEVREMVLDWNKLADKGYIAKVVYPNKTDKWSIYGKTLSKYQEDMSLKAGLDAKYKGFSMSVKSAFSNSSTGSSENEFATYKEVTQKVIVALNGGLNADNLRQCMTNSAMEDINNADLSPEVIIKRYGTHVIPGFVLGGVLDYSLTADMYASSNSANMELAVQAGYENMIGSVSASTNMSSYSSVSTYGVNKYEALTSRGGQSQYASVKDKASYNKWTASLENQDGWIMVDFIRQELLPVWQFAETKARRDALAKYTEQYLKGDLPDAKSTHKKFQLEAVKAKYLGEENNQSGNTQDFEITWATITVNKEAPAAFANKLFVPRLPNKDDSNNYMSKYRYFSGKKIGNGISNEYSLSSKYANEITLNCTLNLVERSSTTASYKFTYDVKNDRWFCNATGKYYNNGDTVEVRTNITRKYGDVLICFRLLWR